MGRSCQVGRTRRPQIWSILGNRWEKQSSELHGGLECAFQTSRNNGKPIIGPINKHITLDIKQFGMIKISSTTNYNTEIFSNKNKTEQLSLEKLQTDFGTKIDRKKVFHTIYGKPYFILYYGHHLRDHDFPSPLTKNWKLGTEMGRVSKL